MPRGESIFLGRSRCPACGAQIAAYDNVPVVSWLVLRGRARCCCEPISARYPLTELTMAALFAAVALRFHGDAGEIALGLVFVSTLVAITLTDLERRIIPNADPRGGGDPALAIVAIADPGSLPERPMPERRRRRPLPRRARLPERDGPRRRQAGRDYGAVPRRQRRPGDAAALLAGSVVGLALVAREGAAARKRAIPFGPFLALGGMAGLFAGRR